MSVSHSVFYLLANTQDSFVSPRSKESLLVHLRCPITRMQDYIASSQARLRTWDCRSQSWRDCRLGIGSGEAPVTSDAWLFAVFSHGRGAKRASRISFTRPPRTLVRVGEQKANLTEIITEKGKNREREDRPGYWDLINRKIKLSAWMRGGLSGLPRLVYPGIF